jgi:hypothetical protein
VAGRTDVGKHVSSVGGTDSHCIPIDEREEGLAPLDAGIDPGKELCQNVRYETKTYGMHTCNIVHSASGDWAGDISKERFSAEGLMIVPGSEAD